MTIIVAEPCQAAPAADALGGDMNGPHRAQFQDKLSRYARKPDRALFLARNLDRTVGFSTVIEFLNPPRDISSGRAETLTNLACGTGLMVLAPWRSQGLGRRLAEQWEFWALERGCGGVWCVTHRMADWYRGCLGYQRLASTKAKGVVKTLMVKRFAPSGYP
jgi:GNAT superfamily N-acetyltransferase